MSLIKHYLAIDSAVDAQAALPYVFMAAGDVSFTAEKRTSEAFFTRSRGRSLTEDLFSSSQTSSEVGDEDNEIESDVTKSRIKIINQFLELRISKIEKEYETEGRITANIKTLTFDLKAVYGYLLSKLFSIDDLKEFISPDISKELWLELWDTKYLNVTELTNFTDLEIESTDKGETKLLRLIKNKVTHDRYQILDDLITYFSGRNRSEVVDFIKVSEFKFISEVTSGIRDLFNLSTEEFHVVNAARVNYLSKLKLDLNYSLELVDLAVTTYKKRSSRIKEELLDAGEELGSVNNIMQDYLISR